MTVQTISFFLENVKRIIVVNSVLYASGPNNVKRYSHALL